MMTRIEINLLNQMELATLDAETLNGDVMEFKHNASVMNLEIQSGIRKGLATRLYSDKLLTFPCLHNVNVTV